ncbi:uncharacterized protein GGS25DRAFT_483772 [Hypoxylon fragiforme]|uniref:uncharacterized protein n=1 Tax=Hypoxylon fragiforme TaxID=63214 RepID=UPI0020C6BC2E|nr:uncharacterized protein GGS25DRAFT_483772 [Hypoxylon fragiforme]KAI2611716.1 hypothetical protein GGS25DRAFT_483772 [Hypoxylon fragiforme]
MDDLNVEAWRRVHLGDEPIYYSAPPPSNPDDIICLGSDEELDEHEKVAKRLRYEAQGLRYLQGKPLRIMSASLRGPFDKASGWQNPWLPKESGPKYTVPEPSQLPFNQYLRNIMGQSMQQDDSTPGTDSSMRCHVSSPINNGGLQVLPDPPENSKRSRIQSWANEVSQTGTLERDVFWAPAPVPKEAISSPSKKRHAKNAWLKKPSKKTRLSNSQNPAAAASTPTPMPLIRSKSVPTDTNYTTEPILCEPRASRSFQLATPSSIVSQSALEATYEGQQAENPADKTTPSRNNPTHISKSATNHLDVQSTETTVNHTDDQSSYNKNSRENNKSTDPRHSDQIKETTEEPTNQEDQQPQETEEDIDLESYLDQSFHYRARPAKQTTPTANLDVPGTGTCPELTQTGTPESTNHNSMTIAAALEVEQQHPSSRRITMPDKQAPQISEYPPILVCDQDKDGDVPNQQCSASLSITMKEASKGHQAEDGNRQSNSSSDTSTITDSEPSEAQTELVEEMISHPIDSDKSVSMPKDPDSLSVESENVRKSLCELHDDQRAPHPMFETLVSQNVTLSENHVSNKAEPETLRLPANDDSTLVGDPMDPNQRMGITTGKLLPTHDTSIDIDTKVDPSLEPRAVTQISMKDEAQECKSDAKANMMVKVPLSQLELGMVGAMDNSSNLPGNMTEKKSAAQHVKPGNISDENDPTQAALLDPPVTIPRSSLWASTVLCEPDAKVGYNNTKQINDDSNISLQPLFQPLPGSQHNGYSVSRITPSQQSPWIAEPPELTAVNTQEDHATTNTANTTIKLLTTTSSPSLYQGQSPWAGMHTDITSPVKTPFATTTPITHDVKQFNSLSQPPTSADKPGECLSEDLEYRPTTPPQMREIEAHTPELEKSIKAFAIFNTPSPKKRRRSISSTSSRKRGILSRDTASNPWGSRRSSKRSSLRVSFAPLPNNEDYAVSAPASSVQRPASPPPREVVDTEDDSTEGHFRTHFDAVKRRASSENMGRPQKRRLLPSESQRIPMSPGIGAMADAFREADKYIVHIPEALDSAVPEMAGQEMEMEMEMTDVEQTPWREESQEVDDVADVLKNLGDFLGDWNIEAEMAKGI